MLPRRAGGGDPEVGLGLGEVEDRAPRGGPSLEEGRAGGDARGSTCRTRVLSTRSATARGGAPGTRQAYWFRARGQLSAGAVEGLNGKVSVITNRDCGFRTYRAVEVALCQTLGHLPVPDVTHRFC